MPLILYHVGWCPECKVVRRRLAELNVAYEGIIVPDIRPMRKQVYEVSGQYFVPVLKDGDTVLSDTREILAHLDTRYSDGSPRREARVEDGEEDQDKFPSCRL